MPWSVEDNDDAIRRGPHKSSHGERAFVAEEMLDFCQQGYWLVLPYSVVRHLPNLRISPLGVVPQRDRRPRLIVDYSHSDVNHNTLPLAPREAMQFGRALQRVLSTIVHVDPRYGPVHLAKIDVADGFYRVWLQVADIPKLGVALPVSPGGKQLVAFPLTLPMGWVQSPPYFTVVTETACDRANLMLTQRTDPRLRQAHRLETLAATPPEPMAAPLVTSPPVQPTMHGHGRPPVGAVDVYVDDFLLLAQTAAQQTAVMRSALSSIDEVLRPLEPGDPPHRKEPSSTKKMLKGDAHRATTKRILGWDVDTRNLTLSLPPHRLDRLRELLSFISPPRRRLPLKQWHQLLGELRSMSPAIPGSRGLFSALQEALKHSDGHRVRITQRIHAIAGDFHSLFECMAERPARLPELTPTYPSDIGASDACQHGMGGVWFDTLDPATPPIVWRSEFSAHVTNSLITATTPTAPSLSRISSSQACLLIATSSPVIETLPNALSGSMPTIGRPSLGRPRGQPPPWPTAPIFFGSPPTTNGLVIATSFVRNTCPVR